VRVEYKIEEMGLEKIEEVLAKEIIL